MQDFPSVIGKIYTTANATSALKRHFVKKVPLFKTMGTNEEFLLNVLLALESASFAPGEYLLHEGERSDGRMYLIAHGHAEIRKKSSATESHQRVGALRVGSIFGEVALLLDTPRVASVVALGHCHVYTLSRDAFETLASVYKDWWRELTSERGVLLEQLRNTGVKVSSQATTSTHGLQLPEVAGESVSSLLGLAQVPTREDRTQQEMLCLVCMCKEKCMLSVPCGHIAACEECQKRLDACPICRASITQAHKAFF
jgi:CRP-like cAMP-binding protein